MSSIYNDYFLSNKIKVFPCAYRNSTYDATARLNTEYNFIHLPHTVDKASYIIKFNDMKLICVIQGYYFEIELGDGDYATLQNKYLNICVASPNGAGSIEGPHLCSWESDVTEGTLDETSVSDTFFAGLKISSGEALSRGSYQCYALKLDASAMLPIMANKIENNAGIPISTSFTTGTLNVASGKLTANSDNITANIPVIINSTLDVKPDATSVLKIESEKVTINKPTDITGATEIKGDSGNLIVAGTGNFGDKLTVTACGAEITGATEIKGGSGNLKVAGTGEFGNKLTVTSGGAEITGATILRGTTEIKNSSDELIFSVDTASGETYAKKINVATSIAETPITDIFGSTSNKIDRLKLRIIEPDTDATWVPGADQSVKIILKKDTDPVKTKAVSFFLAKGGTATVVEADEFIGVAETAQAFKFPATIKLSGDVDGEAESTYGWNIQAEIGQGKVTTDKIADVNVTTDKIADNAVTEAKIGTGAVTTNKIADWNVTNGKIADNAVTAGKLHKDAVITSKIKDLNVTNNKLENSSITIGSSSVSLGSTIGSSASRITGTLYVSAINASGNITANTFNAESDRRLKENIIDYKPEKSILDLPVKKFDFIDGPKNQIGCIAQDLKEICPEIVNENEKGYLSIQESKLVYLLLDEVKKLKKELDELGAR